MSSRYSLIEHALNTNAIIIIFLSLVAVASSHVPVRSDPSLRDLCENEGPEVYCASAERMMACKAEAFCKEYLLRSACEKGPEVFCKSEKTSRFCNAYAYCLTWPDDSVIAIALEEITTEDDEQAWAVVG